MINNIQKLSVFLRRISSLSVLSRRYKKKKIQMRNISLFALIFLIETRDLNFSPEFKDQFINGLNPDHEEKSVVFYEANELRLSSSPACTLWHNLQFSVYF